MKIVVDRYKSNADATLSRVNVYDNYGALIYSCFGCEDEYREVKVPGETRIPAGTYAVGIRDEGRLHAHYRRDRRTRDFHKGMLHVLNVPGFEYILIHIGNYEKDTEGCLLVGADRNEDKLYVTNSAVAYAALYQHVIKAALEGKLTIEYQDNDRR